jgi:hypothetical protein
MPIVDMDNRIASMLILLLDALLYHGAAVIIDDIVFSE